MFHGSSAYRLFAFATSLALSTLIICQTTDVSLSAGRAAGASFATIA